MPNKKAAPQFAFANEEQPQAVLCIFLLECYLTFDSSKKRKERDECKAHKKTTSAVYFRK